MRIEPCHGVFFSAVSAPASEGLGVLFDPFEGFEGLVDLLFCHEALEDMVLEERVRWVAFLPPLKDLMGVTEMANLRDMGLFLRFTAYIILEEFEDREIIAHILSFHLPLGRLPGRSGPFCAGSFDDEDVGGVMKDRDGSPSAERMKKDAGPEKDPPSLRGVLDIGVALLGVKGGAFGTAYQTGLKYIEDRGHREKQATSGLLDFMLFQ